MLYRLIAPERTATPQAPAARARRRSPRSDRFAATRRSCSVVFVGMVASVGPRGDARRSTRRRSPSLGLGVLLASGVLTLEDIAQEGDVAGDVHLVRGALHAEQPAERARLHGLPRASGLPRALGGSAAAGGRRRRWSSRYVLLHYLFVSQTAHLARAASACSSMSASSSACRPAPLAFQLLFATNYFTAITLRKAPRANSAVCRELDTCRNGISTGLGALATACSMLDLPDHRNAVVPGWCCMTGAFHHVCCSGLALKPRLVARHSAR